MGRSATTSRSDQLTKSFRALIRRPGLTACLVVLLFLITISVAGSAVAPHDPMGLGGPRLSAPSTEHLLGTDHLGRDLLSRIILGTRVSVGVGLGSIAIALVAGTALGMVAGVRAGGVADTIIMRAMDVILAFPILVLVVVLSGVLAERGLSLGPLRLGELPVLIIIIGVVFIPLFARVARASTLAEMQEDYVLAARGFGAGARTLYVNNILPNIWPPLLVQAAFSLALAIIIESAVSFLGFGIRPPSPSWGNILSDGRQQLLLGSWWLVVFPASCISVTVIVLNILGDHVSDISDPRHQESATLGEG